MPTPPSEDCEAFRQRLFPGAGPGHGAAAAGGEQGVEDAAAVIALGALLVMV